MATQVITGRDVSLSFSGSLGTDIDAQALSATLTKTIDRQTYQTLDGEAYTRQQMLRLSLQWRFWQTGARQVQFVRLYGQQQITVQIQLSQLQ